jgi:hypothetical protein
MKCKFCNEEMNVSHRSHKANPFCGECLPKRLEAAGAIDLRNNSRLIELGNGYDRIEPIDATKLFKA